MAALVSLYYDHITFINFSLILSLASFLAIQPTLKDTSVLNHFSSYIHIKTRPIQWKKKFLSPESPPLFNGPSASSSLSPFSTFSAWFQYLLHTSPSPAHTSAYSRYIKSWQHYSPYYFYSTYIFYLLSYIHLFPNSLRLLLNFSHVDLLIPFNQSPIHHP